jgi:hypothetical protein
MYQITEYTKMRAKELGLKVQPSKVKNKKIDVYKDNKKIASVGDIRYMDFPHFVKEQGLEFATKKKNAYHKRHAKDSKSGRGFLASYLLW